MCTVQAEEPMTARRLEVTVRSSQEADKSFFKLPLQIPRVLKGSALFLIVPADALLGLS